MDLLRKELEKKRKVVELTKRSAHFTKPSGACSDRNASPSTNNTGRKRTFMRAAEFRRVQEEQHEKEMDKRSQSGQLDNLRKRKREETSAHASVKQIGESCSAKDDSQSKLEKMKDDKDGSQANIIFPESTEEEIKLTGSEITKALREFGIPVWLFGEKDDNQRMKRLREAQESQKATMAGISEKDDYRLGSGHGIRNPFLGGKKDDVVKDSLSIKLSDRPKKEVKADTNSSDRKDKPSTDIDDESNDPHKAIHKFLKTLLRQWEDDLAQRPDSIKRSAVGKNETKTMKQCKDYIRPLFKLCKKRSLDENMTRNILKIVNFCKEGEFVKAHDAYMDVAIGRAAWPIGVTMVGIHARSGRAKIESSNVAHVMNSELQRKYLTSVKRLMSYNQKKRTDVAPSKKVTNL